MPTDPKRMPKKARVQSDAREAWWYEYPQGITVCVEYEGADRVRCAQVRIGWAALLRAAGRSCKRWEEVGRLMDEHLRRE